MSQVEKIKSVLNKKLNSIYVEKIDDIIVDIKSDKSVFKLSLVLVFFFLSIFATTMPKVFPLGLTYSLYTFTLFCAYVWHISIVSKKALSEKLLWVKGQILLDENVELFGYNFYFYYYTFKPENKKSIEELDMLTDIEIVINQIFDDLILTKDEVDTLYHEVNILLNDEVKLEKFKTFIDTNKYLNMLLENENGNFAKFSIVSYILFSVVNEEKIYDHEEDKFLKTTKEKLMQYIKETK